MRVMHILAYMSYVTYTVRELQAHIGDVLRAVERGNRVIVTSRGRPIAELCRPRTRKALKENPIDRKLRQMAAKGSVILGTGGPIRDLPTMRLGGAMRSFLEERRRGDRPPVGRKQPRRKARS